MDVRKTPEKWFYSGGKYPAEKISLRSIASENFLIADISGKQSRTIAELDGNSAFYMIHPEAIYLHEGKQYFVEQLDLEQFRATVRPMDADYYTVPMEHSRVEVLEKFRGTEDIYPANLGEVQVTSQVVGYKKLRFHNMENLGGGTLSLPEQELVTTGFWITLPMDMIRGEFDTEFKEAAAGLVGALAAMHSTASVLLMSDPRDLGSSVGSSKGNWSVQANPLGSIEISGNPSTKAPGHLVDFFIYDRYPGGIGLAESLFDRYPTMIRTALKLVDECECTYGCPGCIGPIITHRPTVKETALTLLKSLESNLEN